jgi:hypothetical protein
MRQRSPPRHLNYATIGNSCAYLTQVGGGAFGNRDDWILSAIRRALQLYEKYPLDVKIVSYRAPDPRLRGLA